MNRRTGNYCTKSKHWYLIIIWDIFVVHVSWICKFHSTYQSVLIFLLEKIDTSLFKFALYFKSKSSYLLFCDNFLKFFLDSFLTIRHVLNSSLRYLVSQSTNIRSAYASRNRQSCPPTCWPTSSENSTMLRLEMRTGFWCASTPPSKSRIRVNSR